MRLREIIRNASSENLDLKAYEADMRHLIDTYIQADEPRKISHFDGVPLVDLIVKTGIAEAIAERLGGLQGNEEAIAETIENNVRSRILKEQLSDPAYFAKMSALLDEIIAARRARAIEYEEFLKRIAELAQRVDAGHEDDTPEPLKRSPALRAVYHSLVADGAIAERRAPYQFADNPALELAIVIDRTVRAARPDDWRDNGGPREEMVKAALYGILHNVDAVERIFPVIKAQPEY